MNSALRLPDVLADLGQISAAINRIGSGQQAAAEEALRLIAQTAGRVAPEAWITIDGDEAGGEGSLFTSAWRQPAGQDQGRRDGQAAPPSGAAPAASYRLEAAGQALGVLSVHLPPSKRRPLREIEQLIFQNLAQQAAMLIFQTRQMAGELTGVQRDLARKQEELARLRHADLLISSRLSLKDTLEAILQMALEMTGARYGIFRLVDEQGRKLVTAAFAGDDLGRPAIEALPINTTSIMGWVAKHRQPLCIADLRANPWARVYYPLAHDREMRAELAVPLIGANGRLEGVLNLESPAVGAFSQEDSHLLQALATQAVIAIQEVRLLDALQEIAERLLAQPPQAVFERLVELACDLLNAPVSNIWVLDAAAEHLTLQASRPGHRRGRRLPLHGSLAGQAILTRQAVMAEDVRTDERFQERELARQQGWAAALAAPMLAGDTGEPVGAFSVYAAAGEPSSGQRWVSGEADWDKKVLAVLAHHAALAVQEASRRAALRQAQEQHAVAETFAAIGDIAANLLHRVNNKVGAIPARIEGIQDKCQAALQADPYLASNLAEIERSAGEAMDAMRESLFHLRPIQMTPVDVAAAVADAIGGAGLPPSVQVRLEGLAELPAVTAGPRRLSWVFVNLLENAANAMQGQGIITVRGSQHGRWVEIAVSDSGPGIPPELHECIFELDFSQRKTHAGKLGFGLWWVKTLMARFGGSVSVESDGQRGATFRLRLPAMEGR